MELSPAVVEWCKYEALGQVLTDWEKMNETPCGYEEVLESLDKDGYSWNSNENITVWEPFSTQWANFLAEQIRNLYDSYISCAEFALGFDIPNSEGLTPRQLNSIVEQIAEDE